MEILERARVVVTLCSTNPPSLSSLFGKKKKFGCYQLIKDNLSKSLSLDLLCGAHCTGVFLLELKHPRKRHVINSVRFWMGNKGRRLIDDRVVRSGGDLHFLRVRCICDIELKGQGFFLKFSLSKTYHLSQQKELKIYKNMNPSFKMFCEKISLKNFLFWS